MEQSQDLKLNQKKVEKQEQCKNENFFASIREELNKQKLIDDKKSECGESEIDIENIFQQQIERIDDFTQYQPNPENIYRDSQYGLIIQSLIYPSRLQNGLKILIPDIIIFSNGEVKVYANSDLSTGYLKFISQIRLGQVRKQMEQQRRLYKESLAKQKEDIQKESKTGQNSQALTQNIQNFSRQITMLQEQNEQTNTQQQKQNGINQLSKTLPIQKFKTVWYEDEVGNFFFVDVKDLQFEIKKREFLTIQQLIQNNEKRAEKKLTIFTQNKEENYQKISNLKSVQNLIDQFDQNFQNQEKQALKIILPAEI
ncbi:hypothetical protein PPERSA_06418 [Pseudocohnilembus persalinus]|uniref:Uncharacterized protein n=1 Tax=Pseudocohnilembus persalinus TaxID=266149 RepID=A0A0V0QRZ8_PSEPJ|nr:hypothetical protein PPERSA_06418 [Pseudocohnilembus persalinus]|eukprot:KRX04784.1 hypothetical protein PPERSA_06418 [Pseudocohnilembus persalinus]